MGREGAITEIDDDQLSACRDLCGCRKDRGMHTKVAEAIIEQVGNFLLKPVSCFRSSRYHGGHAVKRTIVPDADSRRTP